MPSTTAIEKATSADALSWMRELQGSSGSYLFRGQTAIYETVLPSLCRTYITEADRSAWWGVLRRFVSARNGITGYRVKEPEAALGIAQHYLLRSTVIDLTSTPEIALYFALQHPSNKEAERIIYAIDTNALDPDLWIVKSCNDIILPLEHGGFQHRWLRQDGHTIGSRKWQDLEEARKLDLLQLPGLLKFELTSTDQDQLFLKKMGNLESVAGDPLAGKVRSVFASIAKGMGCLDQIIKQMPVKTSIDMHQLLLDRLTLIHDLAKSNNANEEDLKEIQNLLNIATGHIHWQTSCDAGLEHFEAKYLLK